MWDLLTALLILSPITPPVPHKAPAPAWQALKRVALRLEVVGPGELWIDDYRSEVGYVRTHWRELADAPPLADAYWLPPAAVAREWRCFNLRYQQGVQQRRAAEAHHREEWSDALQEAEQICEILFLVETAASPNKSWVCRRQALRQLRELLGPEAYAAGRLPPCVPLWRFQPAGR